MSYGSKLGSLRAETKSFIIWLNKNYETRINPHHYAPRIVCKMDRNCPVCFGIGWVCENHPDRAWHEELGCMCGAGMPCECNMAEETGIDEPGVSQGMIQGSEGTKH
jgi:hypothetical protein